MSLKKKLTLLVILPVVVCTALAIVTSSINIRSQGIENLEEKSNAILTLNIIEYSENHQYGSSLFDEEKYDRLKGVTSIPDSLAEQYEFRIASKQPKSDKHIATKEEIFFLNQFENENKDGITHIDKASNSMWVMRPVYMDKEKGCIRCHKLKDSQSSSTNNSTLRGMFVVKSKMDRLQNKMQKSIIENTLIGSTIAIIAVILGVLFMSRIIQALKKVVTVSQQVSEGNLQNKVEISTKDEFKDLGQFINTMIASLSNILEKVKEASSNLIERAGSITNVSNEISHGTHEQVVQLDELSASIKNTTENLVSADKLANESASKAGLVESEMDNIVNAISDIEKSSQEINHEVVVIEDIARNINILALNAAVEAARAGEHGKGFSIVATEVRKLSQLTSQSSDKITKVASKSLSQVESGVKIINESTVKIKQIIELVNQIAVTLDEISDATQEQLNIMDKNLHITGSNSTSASNLKEAADELNLRANNLIEMVELFKLKK